MLVDDLALERDVLGFAVRSREHQDLAGAVFAVFGLVLVQLGVLHGDAERDLERPFAGRFVHLDAGELPLLDVVPHAADAVTLHDHRGQDLHPAIEVAVQLLDRVRVHEHDPRLGVDVRPDQVPGLSLLRETSSVQYPALKK